MSDLPAVVFLPQHELRALFNELRLFERMQAGEFTERIKHNTPVSRDFLPPGSRSQVIDYYDRHNRRIATVHCYRCPDGTIGASGRPDPKYVAHQGTVYKLSEKREREGRI